MDVSEKLRVLEGFSTGKTVLKPNRDVYIVESGKIRDVFKALIDSLGVEGFYLSTIVGTDLKEEDRIRIDYHVVVLPQERNIVIRTSIPRSSPEIDSIVDIVPAALSGECETHDLLGVVFRGNNFLRRSFFVSAELTEKGVYPLKKDSGV
uniref:NADH-quinone oxidoreductase subunit C n=1 Tax=Ignisphaera aggregans TaxID=334771 RepID=A0A7C2VHL0_9CREN